MTNLEALKAKVTYPLKDNSFKLALLDHGLTDTDTYTTDNKKAIELAQADLILSLISAPNVSEGGYTISLSDKASLRKLASGIYKKWGIADPFAPTAKFTSPW